MSDDLTSRAEDAERGDSAPPPPPQAPPQKVVVENKSGGGIGCFGFLVILALLYGIGDLLGLIDDDEKGDRGGGPTPYEQALRDYDGPSEPEVEAVVAGSIDGSKPNADCDASSCTITYNAGQVLGVLVSPGEELLEDQRYVWKGLLSEPSMKQLTLVAESRVESIGGKASTAPALEITCDQAAAKQINWLQVDLKGIRILCDYRELVDFS